jgi:hypothetical protein
MRYFSFSDLFKQLDLCEILNWLRNHPEIEEDDFGISAIAQAVYDGKSELVGRILDEKLSKCKSTGSSALGGVFQCKNKLESQNILRILLRAGYPTVSEDITAAEYMPELNEPLVHAAIRRGRVDLLLILLRSGGTLEVRDSDGISANQLMAIVGLDPNTFSEEI